MECLVNKFFVVTNPKKNFMNPQNILERSKFNKEQTDIIVADIANIVNEIIEMSNRCLDIILVDENVPIPYQQVKKSLNNGDVKEFISLLNSIMRISLQWYRAERMHGTAYSGRMVPVPNIHYTRC